MPTHRLIIILLIAAAVALCLILSNPAPLTAVAPKPDDDTVTRKRYTSNFPGYCFRTPVMPILPTVAQ